jgi:hypothetical protein
MENVRMQLQHERAEVSRLQKAVQQLEASEAQHTADAQALRSTARRARDQFVSNLVLISKQLCATQEQAKAEVAASTRVRALEQELQQSKLALLRAQQGLKRMGENDQSADIEAGKDERLKNENVNIGERDMAVRKPPGTTRAPVYPPLTSPQPVSPPASDSCISLTVLGEPLILHIFSFLNAPDVLAVSEVCQTWHSRIGAMFGSEEQGAREEGEAGRDAWKSAEDAMPLSEPRTEMSRGSESGLPLPVAPSSSSSFLKSYGHRLLGGQAADVLSSSLSSFLPPPSRAAATARSLLGSSDGGSGASAGGSSRGPVLSERVAASLSSKLSSAELKSILALTERVKKMESLVAQFQVENENAWARLEGAEVAHRLVLEKLKEAETEATLAGEREQAATRQRDSDQEVIGFLDGRVQDLEKGLERTVARLGAVNEEATRDKMQLQDQVRVLQDLLNFERRNAEEDKAQWREHKRILAKEVKSLRGEVVMRQKERDEYRDEARYLRVGGGSWGRNGFSGLNKK